MALSKIQAESMNLADTYAFSGTVSGATPITHIDQWRLTANFAGGATPISSNLERVDTTGQATLGSAMTVSSGVFSFPVTGIWLIKANYLHYINGNSRYQSHYINVTTNNSNYSVVGEVISFIKQTNGSSTYTSAYQELTLDVTDVANVKCSFTLATDGTNVGTIGTTTQNQTYFTFIRLGDT